jgi:hypothetical protein
MSPIDIPQIENGVGSMATFVKFMTSPAGRLTRIVAGVLLLGGAWLIAGIAGIVIGLVALVPLLAGLADRCVFAPLFGFPFNSPDARARLAGQA